MVIGGGSAGGEAGRRAALEHGARVAVIERKRWGGECGSVACKPTKQYAAAADLLNDIRSVGGDLGIETGTVSFDLAALNARKDWLIGSPERWRARFGVEGMTQIDGEAMIVGAGTVKVGDRVLTTERILVATGSRVAVPPVAGLTEIAWLDNEAALNLTETPGAMLVIGAGAVGLEFGQMFARFGSTVTIVSSSPTIAGRADHEAADALAGALRAEGIAVLTGSTVRSVARAEGGRITAELDVDGESRTVVVDEVRVDDRTSRGSASRSSASRSALRESSSTRRSAPLWRGSGQSVTPSRPHSSPPSQPTRVRWRFRTCSAAASGGAISPRCRGRSSPIPRSPEPA